MTHMQVKMPEHLTAKDIDGIAYVFSKMSLPSKQTFLATLLINHPEHYIRICKALGEDFTDAMVYA